MLDLADYALERLLHTGRHTKIYAGTRQADRRPVVVKTSAAESPSASDITALQREFAIGQQIDSPHVIDYLGLVWHAQGVAIIEEDFGGQPLSLRVTAAGSPIDQVLHIVRAVARGIEAVHEAGYVHRDLSPFNILVDPHGDVAKVIDLGCASELPQEYAQAGSPDTLEGSLVYMSPEQTGRMNRMVDSRSDLYSVGAILYELLSGRPPFVSDDPLELIHCHIAREPVPLRKRRMDVPEDLSAIVMRLLAKSADDRYTGAAALAQDLDRCHLGDRPGPVVASASHTGLFRIPQRLDGREQEIERLVASFDRVCRGDGRSALTLIAGYSGIGKSSLIHEVHKPLVRERGRFASGKFDQLRRDLPYSSFIQAFQGLVRQLLGESEDSIQQWRRKILGALGESAQVIVDVIPEVEAIIGPQPPAPTLGAAENQNRFLRLFTLFSRIFASRNCPLVIFLDDLQWADLPTLALLRHIASDPDCHHMLLIGAYRDNEVDSGHPLLRTLHDVEQHIHVEQITLGPLSFDHVSRLVADSLDADVDRVHPLARLVFEKTQGNPFFLKMFLTTLYADEMLSFSFSTGAWQWDQKAIAALDYTNNVVDLMVRRLRALPPRTQQTLSLAACFGDRAAIRPLALLEGAPSLEVYEALLPALKQGLVLPLGTGHRWVPYLADEHQTARFRFSHDRVQQAALALMPAAERPELHLRIGRLLLASLSETEIEESLFDVVSHCNEGAHHIDDPDERLSLAELDLRAARKAKLSSAYPSALTIARAGVSFLTPDAWATHYDLRLSYQLELGELEYLNARWDEAIETLNVALTHAEALSDRCRINEYRATLFRMKNDLQGALEVGLEALRDLGIELSAFPGEDEVAREVQRAATLVADLDVEALYDLPELDDPLQRHAMALLRECFAPAYFLGSRLIAVIGVRMTELTIQHGSSEHSAVGFIFLSSITLSVNLRDYDTAYRFGRVALRLTDQRYQEARVHEALIRDMWGTFVCHHKDPVDTARAELLRGFESGVEHGSYQWAGYCAIIHLFMSFWGDCTLEEVEGTLDRISPGLGKIDPNNVQYYHAVRAAVHNLRVQTATPCELSETHWPNKEDVLARTREQNDILTPFIALMCRLALANWFGDRQLAVALADEAAPTAANLPGWYLAPVFLLHQSLAYAAAYDESPADERARHREIIELSRRQFDLWATHAPTTYAHQAQLLRAELARIDGDVRVAMDSYDAAIDSARASGFTQNEALACERASAFYRALGKPRLVPVYDQAARSAYQRWGALARVEDLEAVEPAEALRRTMRLEALDLASLLKVSQTIAEETVPERLLSRALRVIAESAGAQRGVLVTCTADDLLLVRARLEADADVDQRVIPLAECQDVSAAAVRYVVRFRQIFGLSDAASQRDPFADDPHLSSGTVKSMLCLPLENKERLLGVLYLENNLTTNAFSDERLPVLQALLSQAASALDKAVLYEDLRREVVARKETEEILRFDRARFAGVLDLAGEGILSVNADQEIVMFNQCAEEIFGYTAAEVLGKPIGLLVPQDLGTSHKAMVGEFANRPGPVARRERVQGFGRRKGGEEFPVEVSISKLDLSGKQLMTAVVRDLTERQRAEQALAESREQLWQAQKMEAVGQLAGGIAHELNNLLGIILGHAELLQKKQQNGPHAGLAKILKACDSAGSLTRQLLAFSRKLNLRPEVFDLNGQVRAVEDMLSRLLDSDIELKLDLDPTLDTICADPDLVQQVVLNLVLNARDAMTDGGRIFIRTQNVSLGSDGAPTVLLSVEDQGCGMDAQTLAQVFEPFFTTKGIGKGTGLGLSTVYGIVKQSGGDVAVRSEVGIGTTFDVFFPRAVPSEKSLDLPVQSAPGQGGTESVLLVEDEPDFLELTTVQLRRAGYRVTAAGTGEEALVTTGSFEILLTDLELPGMNGFELAERFTRDRPDVAVVYMSGYFREHRGEYSALPNAKMVQKPFREEVLLRSVREALEDRRS